MSRVRHAHAMLLAAVWSAAVAGAQTTQVVVPGGAEKRDASGAALWVTGPFTARRQLAIDARHLSGAGGQSITALAFRRSTGGGNETLAGGMLTIEVRVSNVTRAPEQLSPHFATNRGADHQVVFSGTVAFPSSPPAPQAAPAPAPWRDPFAVTLAFTKPFVYKGRHLLIETTTWTRGKAPWWPVDAVVDDVVGTVQAVGTSCIHELRGQPAGAEPRSLAVGATAVFRISGPREDGFGLFALGGRALDIDLTAAGAPGCRLYTDLLLVSPFRLQESELEDDWGIAWARLQLPGDRRFAGVSLSSQWLMLERRNRLGITFSNGVRARIGRPAQPLGVRWVEAVKLSAPAGDVQVGRAPVLRLSFRRT